MSGLSGRGRLGKGGGGGEVNTFSCSVGKGPPPTRVVYAFTTPMISFILKGLRARPVRTPPMPVLEEVT